MTSLDPLVRALESITAEGGETAPLRICQAAVAALPVDGAAITAMIDADLQEPICASDALSGRIDEIQFSLGEGPCVEAVTTGRPVLIADLREGVDQRWPMFAAQVRLTAARALYVLPLQLGTIKVGVLDLYSLAPGMLPPEHLTGALRVADAAMWTLLGTRDGATLDGGRGPVWADAPLHRAHVHQATGMIVVQAEVPVATALAMLRAFAFANERPIDEVAGDVVARRLSFEEGSR